MILYICYTYFPVELLSSRVDLRQSWTTSENPQKLRDSRNIPMGNPRIWAAAPENPLSGTKFTPWQRRPSSWEHLGTRNGQYICIYILCIYIYTWPCWKNQNIKVSSKSNANYLVMTYCDPYHDHKYALVVGKSSRVFTQLLPNLGLPTCCGDP